MSLELPNGSRIVGLPGNEATVRGFSAVSLLLVDEAARVSDDMYLAVRPMLAVSDGHVVADEHAVRKAGILLRDVGGRRAGMGAGEGTGGGMPADPAAFLEEERRTMGERWYRQEYGCEFVDSVSGVFDRDLVERAITRDVKPLELIKRAMRSIYFAGLDLGQRQDPTAMAVVERREYDGAWDAAAYTHRKGDIAEPAVPGADPVGDAVSGGGGAGGWQDAVAATGGWGAAPPGGGCDGSGRGRWWICCGRKICNRAVAGDDHGRGHGEICGRLLPGAEAGPDCRFAGVDAAGRATDCGGDGGGGNAGAGDGGDAGQDIGER